MAYSKSKKWWWLCVNVLIYFVKVINISFKLIFKKYSNSFFKKNEIIKFDYPLNFELAWGLPGQPYFWEAQAEKTNINVRIKKAAKILFFIMRDVWKLNVKNILLFYYCKDKDTFIFIFYFEQ